MIRQWQIHVILGIIGLVLAFHQLVQPILFPRIESLFLAPLYIQSQTDTSESGINVNYYRVFKIAYIIKPVLLFEHNIKIDLPPDVELFTPLSGFIEKNPYAELISPEEALNSALLDSNKFKNVTYHINAKGMDIERFPIALLFRELVNLECANLVFSNDKWWSPPNVPPGPKIECFTKRLGLGKINESGIVFSFDELIVRNRGDLDVRGFVSKINFGNSPQLVVCENKRELITMEYKNNDYREGAISFDLKSGETRRFIVLKQAPEYKGEDIKSIRFPNEWQKFDFTSPYCGADWNNFIQ